jgi:hypothetical protein
VAAWEVVLLLLVHLLPEPIYIVLTCDDGSTTKTLEARFLVNPGTTSAYSSLSGSAQTILYLVHIPTSLPFVSYHCIASTQLDHSNYLLSSFSFALR